MSEATSTMLEKVSSDEVSAYYSYTVRQLQTQVCQTMTRPEETVRLVRFWGNTFQRSSNQIHNFKFYAVLRPHGRPLRNLLRSRPDVSRLGVLIVSGRYYEIDIRADRSE